MNKRSPEEFEQKVFFAFSCQGSRSLSSASGLVLRSPGAVGPRDEGGSKAFPNAPIRPHAYTASFWLRLRRAAFSCKVRRIGVAYRILGAEGRLGLTGRGRGSSQPES